MSDVFEGPGWWLASDGKWYPPHLHHDPNYRRAHEPRAQAASPTAPATTRASTAEGLDDVGSGAPVPGSVAEMLAGSESPDQKPDVDHQPDADLEHLEPAQPDVDPDSGFTETGSASEQAAVSEILDRAERQRQRAREERLVDETMDGENARVAHGSESTVPARPSSGRTRLEVGTVGTGNRPERSKAAAADTSRARIGLSDNEPPTSTDLVYLPNIKPPGPESIDRYDRVVAGLLFLAGVAMIVGTFMPWEVGLRTDTSGWALGDGLATVVAGVLGSAAAGPIFVGFRHIVPKTIGIVTGLVGTVVVGLSGLQTVTDSEAARTTVGTGFWIVAFGSIAMLSAGLADRSALD